MLYHVLLTSDAFSNVRYIFEKDCFMSHCAVVGCVLINVRRAFDVAPDFD